MTKKWTKIINNVGLGPHFNFNIMTAQEKITSILRHIKRVEDNCNQLAKHYEDTDLDFALKLIIRGRQHDCSKLTDFEFKNLFEGEKYFDVALQEHRYRNDHHPEFHNTDGNGIWLMDNLQLAEMVCDCVARAQEFVTDARKWLLEEGAPQKYSFEKGDRVYNKIKEYLDILLTKPFNS